MSKSILNVLCGLQGSGKSTYAKELEKYGCYKIFSSDKYRKIHPEMDNNKIFETLYKDLKEALQKGEDCVLDATNVTIKSRKQVLKEVEKIDCKKTITIIATPYEMCLERVKERNKDPGSHYVPLDVIRKYMMSFEIPFYEEGWDEIYVYDNFSNDINFDLLWDMMHYFNQNNEHHKYNLGVHCQKTLEACIASQNKWEMYAYKLHDIGKMFTTSIGVDGQAHYYNHPNVGAYFLLTCNMDEEFDLFEKLELLFLINYHMKPFDWKTEKSINKWKGIFGEKKFNALVNFNRCDRIGSGTENDNEF